MMIQGGGNERATRRRRPPAACEDPPGGASVPALTEASRRGSGHHVTRDTTAPPRERRGAGRKASEPALDYTSALLLGRALAFAANLPHDVRRPIRELCQDAAGDREALLRADALCRRQLASEEVASAERCRAHTLLTAALAALDAGCHASATGRDDLAPGCVGPAGRGGEAWEG